jgi:hypothetical protein
VNDPVRAGGGRPGWGAVTRFGRFWWQFLIGDTPELFVGAVAVVGVIALVCVDHGLRGLAAVALPLLVACLLSASVWRGARRPPR